MSTLPQTYIFSLLHISITLLLAGMPMIAIAQAAPNHLQYECISREQGLQGGAIRAVATDTLGRYWIMTKEGLNSFDGERFTYLNSQTFGFNARSSTVEMYTAKDHTIWLIKQKIADVKKSDFWKGHDILVLDPYRYTISRFEDYYSNIPFQGKDIRQMDINNKGIGVITYQNELFHMDGIKTEPINRPPIDSISHFIHTPGYDLQLWHDQYLYRTNRKGVIQEIDTLPNEIWKVIPLDESQSLLILYNPQQNGTKKFAIKISGQKPKMQDHLKEESLQYLDLGVLDNNQFLARTNQGWLPLEICSNRLEANGLLDVGDKKEIKVNFTYNNQEKQDWIWTEYEVCRVKIKANHFKRYTQDVPISIRSIEELDNGDLLIASYSGMKLFVQQQDRLFDFRPAGIDILAGYVATKADSLIWVGMHSNKLCSFTKDFSTYKTYSLPQGKGVPQILIPYPDASGRVWLCLQQGLAVYDQILDVSYYYDFTDNYPELANATFRQFLPTAKGFWCVTDKGLFLFDTEQSRFVQNKRTIRGRNLFYVHRVSSQEWYFVTDNNYLYRYLPQTDKLDSLMVFPDYLENRMHAIIPVRKHEYFLPSNNGLFHLDLKDGFNSSVIPQQYLAEEEFNFHAQEVLSDGRIALGGINGLFIVDPNLMVDQPIGDEQGVLLTKIEIFSINDQQVRTLNLGVERKRKINLQADEKRLNFYFAYPDLITRKKTYAYKLDQSNWRYLEGARLDLNYLPSGTHRLEVAVFAEGNLRALAQEQLQFYIPKPWYARPYSLMTFGLLSLLIVYTWFRQRLLQAQKINARLEVEVAARTQRIAESQDLIRQQNEELNRLNKAKDRMFGMLGHELKGPLQSFAGVSKKLNYLIAENRWQDVGKLSKQLDAKGGYIINQLDNLLIWSRTILQDGKPMASWYLLKEELDIVKIDLEEKTQRKNIKIRFQEIDPCYIYFDGQAFRTVIRNLLDNAVKFSMPGGEVQVFLQRSEQGNFLLIVDAGTGIDAKTLSLIQRDDFHLTTTGTAGEKGTGLGLRLCRELLRKNGSYLEIISTPMEGTTIRIYLPKVAAAEDIKSQTLAH